MNLTTRNLLIGTFTFFALVVLALGMILTGKKGGLFTPTYSLIAEFDSVQGLREGNPVWLQGVQVGFVKDISFSPITEKKVRVVLSIEKRYQELIRSDSLARTTTKGLLGDQLIEITIGSPDTPVLPEGATIETRSTADLSALLRGVADSVAALREFVATLRTTAEKLEQGGGTLGKFLTDDRLYRELLSVVGQLRKMSENLNQGRGSLGRLLNDPSLAQELEGLLKDLRRGKGSLSHLLHDPRLYQELVSTVAHLRKLTEGIERGEGSLGKAISDETLYQNLNDLVLELKKLTEDMRKNPARYFRIKVF